MLLWGDEKPKRKRLGKTEWEAVKKLFGNKCVICGESEKKVGGLQQAHLKPHRSGGSQVVPMCSNCHKRFDRGELTATELKKIKLTREEYNKLIKGKKKRNSDPFLGI